MAKRNLQKVSLFLPAALAALIFAVLASQVKPAVAGSDYTDAIAKIVKGVVEDPKNIANAPGLVRLLFHDAFVRGLDGSVLLMSTPFDTPGPVPGLNITGPTEQGSPSNGNLRGLNMIEEIRAALFKVLGLNVSCADSIAFAAREATNVLSRGAIKYSIDGPGRLDGVVSKADEPGRFLPGPTYSFGELVTNFTAKGFTWKELVALSGAHCIGVAHHAAVVDRFLPNATLGNQVNAAYLAAILVETKNLASPEFEINVRDMTTARGPIGYQATKEILDAVGRMDHSYFYANPLNMVPFTSDWALMTNDDARSLMDTYKQNKNLEWYKAFSAAMTKLSNTLKVQGKVERGYRNRCTETNFRTKEDYP